MNAIRSTTLVFTLATSALTAGCHDDGQPPVGAAAPVSTYPVGSENCDAVDQILLSNTRITLKQNVPAGLVAPSGSAANAVPTVPVPDHCHVQGKIAERTGIDGKPYAIGFDLRLPKTWNGRFFFQGGGGTDGALQDAFGTLPGAGNPSNALSQGYAVVFTDTGHLNEAGPVGSFLFGLDPQARIDNGYNSMDQTTRVAKSVINAFYGRQPAKSYFVGCSNGGRQGMIMAQRFPDYFDGVLAGAPAYRVPEASADEANYTQQFARAAADQAPLVNGRAVLSKAFSSSDLALLRSSIVATCDARDGLADGMIQNLTGCQYDPAVLQCTGAKTATCLSPVQVDSLKKSFAGARDSSGQLVYSDWAFDSGVGAPGWTVWKLGSSQTDVPSAIDTSLIAGALAYFFTTPPTATTDLYGYLLGFNFDTDTAKIFATSGAFTPSGSDVVDAKSDDLTAFRAHGGKLMFYHGGSDPIFSYRDTIAYQNRLVTRYGDATATDFSRLFLIPGMNHCSGGPATDQFDGFGALVDWVENGHAPDRIVATARANNTDVTWPNRTRPLCVYPKQARYNGTGSIEDAANFTCQVPG